VCFGTIDTVVFLKIIYCESLMAIYVDDKDLVAAHKAGNTEAFDHLARQYRSELISHAYRRLNCMDASEDAVQETMVRAYKALPRFDGEYKLGPWLHRILANVCVDEANRRTRDKNKTERVVSLRSDFSSAPSVEEELGYEFDHSGLEEALTDLPDPYREALTLKYVDELDYGEVAYIAGVSEENARARVSRARTKMRTLLKGVAVLPGVLLGILRRGEKVAAASTTSFTAVSSISTGGVSATASTAIGTVAHAVPATSLAMPMAAEAVAAVSQVAPTMIPIITKAAVGLGLAAAVFAPTSDSAMHQVVENLAIGASGIATQESIDNSSDLAAPVVVDLVSSSSKNESESVPSITQQTDETNLEEMSKVSIIGVDNETGEAATSISDVELNAIEELEQIGGSLTSASLKAEAEAAGRFNLTGSLALVVGEATLMGELMAESQMWVAPQNKDGENIRIDGSLVVRLTDGEIAKIRLAGFIQGSGVNSGWTIYGLYRSTVSSLPLIDQGSFSGEMDLTPDSELLALTFTS
jgi:RNA polymerase sigma-70 factor (ECF subfamily)